MFRSHLSTLAPPEDLACLLLPSIADDNGASRARRDQSLDSGDEGAKKTDRKRAGNNLIRYSSISEFLIFIFASFKKMC